MLLALAGYEANCFDMVETGLATHLVSDSSALPLLEENLAAIPPWGQQRLVQNPRRLYGRKLDFNPNRWFRNVTIANVIEQLSEHSSDPTNSLPYDFTVTNAGDPALDVDHADAIDWESGSEASERTESVPPVKDARAANTGQCGCMDAEVYGWDNARNQSEVTRLEASQKLFKSSPREEELSGAEKLSLRTFSLIASI